MSKIRGRIVSAEYSGPMDSDEAEAFLRGVGDMIANAFKPENNVVSVPRTTPAHAGARATQSGSFSTPSGDSKGSTE